MFISSLPPAVFRRAHILSTLIGYIGDQHILCCVFVLFFFVLGTLCWQFLLIVLFLIAPSVFSNVYFSWQETILHCVWFFVVHCKYVQLHIQNSKIRNRLSRYYGPSVCTIRMAYAFPASESIPGLFLSCFYFLILYLFICCFVFILCLVPFLLCIWIVYSWLSLQYSLTFICLYI